MTEELGSWWKIRIQQVGDVVLVKFYSTRLIIGICNDIMVSNFFPIVRVPKIDFSCFFCMSRNHKSKIFMTFQRFIFDKAKLERLKFDLRRL